MKILLQEKKKKKFRKGNIAYHCSSQGRGGGNLPQVAANLEERSYTPNRDREDFESFCTLVQVGRPSLH